MYDYAGLQGATHARICRSPQVRRPAFDTDWCKRSPDRLLFFDAGFADVSALNFGVSGDFGRRMLIPNPAVCENPQAHGRLLVEAVFERFTERAIKAVMLAQQEAKALGRAEVGKTRRI